MGRKSTIPMLTPPKVSSSVLIAERGAVSARQHPASLFGGDGEDWLPDGVLAGEFDLDEQDVDGGICQHPASLLGGDGEGWLLGGVLARELDLDKEVVDGEEQLAPGEMGE
jgi:hypothetical protein